MIEVAAWSADIKDGKCHRRSVELHEELLAAERETRHASLNLYFGFGAHGPANHPSRHGVDGVVEGDRIIGKARRALCRNAEHRREVDACGTRLRHRQRGHARRAVRLAVERERIVRRAAEAKNLPARRSLFHVPQVDSTAFETVVVLHAEIVGPAYAAPIEDEAAGIHVTVIAVRATALDAKPQGLCIVPGRPPDGERLDSLASVGEWRGVAACGVRPPQRAERGEALGQSLVAADAFALSGQQRRLSAFARQIHQRDRQSVFFATVGKIEISARRADALRVEQGAFRQAGGSHEIPVGAERTAQRCNQQCLVAGAIDPVARPFGIDAIGPIGGQRDGGVALRGGKQVRGQFWRVLGNGERAEDHAADAHLSPVVGGLEGLVTVSGLGDALVDEGVPDRHACCRRQFRV